MATAFALIVMPRSRSSEFESRCWDLMSRPATVLVSTRMRSARVDLPWSMWATMQKFRILSILMGKSIRLGLKAERGHRLGAGGGGLADLPRLELAGGPEGGAQPAGIVAGYLGSLDADLLEEDAEDALADAGADAVDEEVAGQRHAARQHDDVGMQDVDHVREAGREPVGGPVDHLE